jgi:iron(III) transport system substrate-binding protein
MLHSSEEHGAKHAGIRGRQSMERNVGLNRKKGRRVAAAIQAAVVGVSALAAAHADDTSSPEWKNLIEAARKEGVVVVSGHPGDLERKSVTVGWAKAFPDIRLEYTPARGTQLMPRVVREREAKIYNWDVVLASTDPTVFTLVPINALAPLRDALLPELQDDKTWVGGFEAGFMDEGKKYFYSPVYARGFMGFINRDCLSRDQLNKADDLKSPALKNKTSWFDPFVAGTGALSTAIFHIVYGDNWLKDMLQNHGVVFSRDYKQMTDWMMSCAKPVAIGLNADVLEQLQSHGVGKNVEEMIGESYTGNWRKGGPGGGASIGWYNNAPHPNAAKLFVNWYLSHDEQEFFAKTSRVTSRRADVKPADARHLPEPGLNYFSTSEKNVRYTWEVQEKIKSWGIAER